MTFERTAGVRLGLRAKLAVAFGGLLVIVVVVAAGGIVWSSRLGESIQVILSENFRSVLAVQDMKESLERMDSGALFSLTGDPAQGRTLIEEYGPRFRYSLDLELSNLTLPGERDRAEKIAVAYESYEAALTLVIDGTRPVEERRELYYGKVLPRFQEIKRLSDEILDMNQGNMSEASVRARYLAATARHQMVLALLAGTLLAVFCVAFLARSILRPLARLTASARQIEQGHYELVVEPTTRDEIGQLAEAFNSMARRLRALRRSDQARLAMAQRVSQLTINSLPEGVILLDPSLEVELANREAREVLGVSPGEPLPPAHREWIAPLVEEATRIGGVQTRRSYDRAVQLFVGGRERFFLPQAVAIQDADLGVMGVTVILVDVTELRRLDAMKSNLVSTVSHELMTPLTSLAMALHILLGERIGALSPKQIELLTTAREDADRLRQILEGLLDVSRLESGAAQLRLGETTVEELVSEAAEPLRPAFRDKGVDLGIELDDGALRVLADSTRATLLIGNLLTNALKHTPPGGGVTVSSRAAGGRRAEVSVRDTGTGIPPEHRERIFDRFFRMPGETSRGAGLGLAIAKEIAEAHGGRLWLDPEAGPGAVFRFELRLAS
jgi:signal transduction histidine kinase